MPNAGLTPKTPDPKNSPEKRNGGNPSVCKSNDDKCMCNMKMEMQAYMFDAHAAYSQQHPADVPPFTTGAFLDILQAGMNSSCMMRKECTAEYFGNQDHIEELYYWWLMQGWDHTIPGNELPIMY